MHCIGDFALRHACFRAGHPARASPATTSDSANWPIPMGVADRRPGRRHQRQRRRSVGGGVDPPQVCSSTEGQTLGSGRLGPGEILAVGACGDLVGGACPVVAGGDDAAYQLRGVAAGAAAHDVRAVGLLGVFVVAFGDPLIQVGGVGVAAARVDSTAQRCGRHPRTRSPSRSVLASRATATAPGSSVYTSRTALLTKRSAVRSTDHRGYQACMMRGEMWPRRQEGISRLTQAHRAVPS